MGRTCSVYVATTFLLFELLLMRDHRLHFAALFIVDFGIISRIGWCKSRSPKLNRVEVLAHVE